jgi:hypothetical protein
MIDKTNRSITKANDCSQAECYVFLAPLSKGSSYFVGGEARPASG